jgi:molybdopterin converting factor small subunit
MSDAAALNDSLASNYMLVDLQLRSWSGKSTDREVSSEVIHNKGATRDSGKFVKNLFAGADGELKAVNQMGNTIRAFVYAKTLPWSNNSDGAKRGERLIAATKSFEFLKELNEIKREYDLAVATLVSVYDARITEAKSNLQGMANDADYPSVDTVADRFAVSVDLRPVPTLQDFSRVNVPSALAEALGQRHMQLAEAQIANAMSDLKQRLLEQLQRMAVQLNKAGDGTKTRLYDSLVTNLQDLVSLARTMNVRNNQELSALADKIEVQLLQHPVEVYRVHPQKAATVAKAAQTLAVEAALEEIWK